MATKPTRSLARAASRRRCCLAALLLTSAVAKSRAQYIDLWQAQQQASSPWVPTLKYIKTDVELEKDSYQTSTGSAPQGLERFYVAPSFGIQWDYYIYHPYLLNYSLLFEPGYIVRYEGPPDAIQRTDELMLDGKFIANLLALKPYATTLNYDRTYGEVKYDIFNSELVDAQSWGVATGYRDGPVPVTLAYQQSHEDSTGFNQTSTTDQKTVDLHARNERGDQTATDFTYQYGQFDRSLSTDGVTYPSDNTFHHVSLTDTEQYDLSSLKSTLLFYDVDTGYASSMNLNGSVNYNRELTPRLQNYDNYSFSYYNGDGSESFQNFATAGIQHHLYDSLTTGLEARGSTLDTRTDGTSLDVLTAGITASIDYNKKLGDWGRLCIGESPSFTWNDQQATGGQVLVPNESYVVPQNGLVRLNQPREISVTLVTDANNNPLLEGLDYNIVSATDPWQIQILSLGPGHVQPGATILVTYTILSNPSGTYSTLGNQAQITYRFWKERANIFLRYNTSENQVSSPDFVLDNVNELQVGAELNWLGLALHGDYTDHHSTIYSYYGYNLVEDYSMNLDSDSTLGIDLAQQWLTFPTTELNPTLQTEHLSYYNFMLHYGWRPTRHLDVNMEAGYRIQRGFGFDEDLLAIRAYLNWHIGKAEMHVGYEHEAQTLTGEKLLRDFAFIRLRRNF